MGNLQTHSSKLAGYGYRIRPTPTSQGVKKLKHGTSASDKENFKEESSRVRCRTCGFLCKKGRDSKCPFCETEIYWKAVK